MHEEDKSALRRIRGAGEVDNRELSKVLESMLTRGNKADRLVAEGAAVEMRREHPPNQIAQRMLAGDIDSPRRYNREVRIHGSSTNIPQFDGIKLSSKGEGDFYIRRVGPNAGKTTRERNGPTDIAVSIDPEKSGYDPNYAYYLFQSIEQRLNARKHGSLQQAINQRDVFQVLGEAVIPRSQVEEMEKRLMIFEAAQAMSVAEAKHFLQNIRSMPVAHNPETGEVAIMFEQQAKLQEATRIIAEAAEKEGLTPSQYLERGTGPRTDRTYLSKMKRYFRDRVKPDHLDIAFDRKMAAIGSGIPGPIRQDKHHLQATKSTVSETQPHAPGEPVDYRLTGEELVPYQGITRIGQPRTFGTKHVFDLHHQPRSNRPFSWAKRQAAFFRADGYNARTVPMQGGWAVYVTKGRVRPSRLSLDEWQNQWTEEMITDNPSLAAQKGRWFDVHSVENARSGTGSFVPADRSVLLTKNRNLKLLRQQAAANRTRYKRG